MIQALGEFILDFITCVTGHFVLWAFSLGRWKAFEHGDDLATFVGILFWALVVAVVVGLFWLSR